MYELTASELADVILDAGVMGAMIGFLIGIVIMYLFVELYKQVLWRNFKMWYLESDEETKKEYDAHLDTAYTVMCNLAKSNTRFFKQMHNHMQRLKAYISQKFMQN